MTKYSNCCGVYLRETDILAERCPECKENCEVVIQEPRLDAVFYAPSYAEVLTLVLEAYEDDPMYAYGSGHKVMSAIIKKYYREYCQYGLGKQYNGYYNSESLYCRIQEARFAIKQVDVFKNPDSYIAPRDHDAILKPITDVEHIALYEGFGHGFLKNDICDSDPDPYETAGGYRSWIAKAGTPCTFRLDGQNRLFIVYASNCLVDHYNNNFYGNSTGGGHREYEIGERVEKRTKHFKKETLADIMLGDLIKVTEIDFGKAVCDSKANITV